MRVVIRADASTEIGSGHVMRCLTLAGGLRDEGCEVLFICRDHRGHLHEQVVVRGFEVARLPAKSVGRSPKSQHAHWLGAPWEEDVQETCAAMVVAGFSKPDWLVVDHYAIDSRWHALVRPHAFRLLAIDDLADRPHDCDILLDQNLVADFDIRYSELLSTGGIALLGPKFALLQPDYAELHKEARTRSGRARRVLIYFGAADLGDLTTFFLKCIVDLRLEDIAIDVVVGRFHPNFQGLEALIKTLPQAQLYVDLPTLAPLMAAADLAIGASGATSWERLCLKLPAIVVTLAANQRPIAAELNRRGVIHWLGDAENLDVIATKEVLNGWISQCDCDFSDVADVDGYGMKRVLDVMMMAEAQIG